MFEMIERSMFKNHVLRIVKIDHYAELPNELKNYYKSIGLGPHLCGYVKVPENNPCFGKDYDDIEIECHGGLTYGQHEWDGYWIGFDCAHHNDTIENCNHEYVKAQCKSIVDQLILLENKNA